jgi:rare lipoprotein A
MGKSLQPVVRGCALLALGLGLVACTCLPKGRADLDVGMKERGIASWYGEDFHGWLTASGEVFDMETMTAAHRTLPLGTVVRVTNVENGRQVRIRINDRGPYVHGRIIDLSFAAARKLGMMEGGVSAVSLEVVGDQASPFALEDEGVAPGSQVSLLGLLGWLNVEFAAAAREVPGELRRVRSASPYPGDLLRMRRERRIDDQTPDELRV